MFGSARRRGEAPVDAPAAPAVRPDSPSRDADLSPLLADFGSKDPAERTMALCEGLTDVAAALFNVSGRELRQPGRTAQNVTRVRQIAMYIAHTSFKVKMAEVGRCFGRDRTTVLHACHVVEDLRDDVDFERIVAITERVALAAFAVRARIEAEGSRR